jgi:hypothetical protein
VLSLCLNCSLSNLIRISVTWGVTYIVHGGFRAPKIDGILPHFVVLHRMMSRMLALRIDDSDTIPAFNRNLLDALVKNEHFDVFDYIVDEIWNIAINPLRSCGFAPNIICMIEMVARKRFYKDVAHDWGIDVWKA